MAVGGCEIKTCILTHLALIAMNGVSEYLLDSY